MQPQFKALYCLVMLGVVVGCGGSGGSGGGSGAPTAASGAKAVSAALLAKDSDNLAVEWVLTDPGQAAEITDVENNLEKPPRPIELSGTTNDATPLIKGELLQNLDAGQRVHVYTGESWLGAAVVTGTKWTFQSPELGVGNHALQAAIVSADGSVLSRGNVWPVVVHGAASQAQGQSAVVALSLAANFARTPVTQTALSSAPTGSNHLQCFQAGSDDLVACDSPQAIALSGVNKQDGMRLQSGAHRFARVGNQPLSSCVQDTLTGLMWEGKESSGPRSEKNNFTHFDSTQKAQKWFVFDDSDPTPPTQAELNAATNTLGYVKYVNQIALCGATDWRLPTVEELESLVDSSRINPAIATDWFVNTGARWYWTASPNLLYPHYAWLVNFATGTASHSGLRGGMEDPLPVGVRLVRSASKSRVGE